MATQQIRNLINNSIDKPISNAKLEVKKEGKKQVAKIKEQLPSPEELKSKVLSSACTPNMQNKVAKLFEKHKKLLGRLDKKLTKSREKLQGISEKLTKVQTTVTLISGILSAIAEILIGLEVIVRVSPAGLAASSGPAANGLVIKSLSDAIDYAKAKIKEYGGLTQTILLMLPKYLAKAAAILGVINLYLMALDKLYLLVQKLIAYLEFIYLKYIQKCTVADQTPISTEGEINEDLLIGAENVSELADQMTSFYNDLLDTLSQRGFTLQAERIYSIDSTMLGGGMVKRSYALIEVPKTT
jgi:hypothetical protein